jgi:hypothetical protein
MTGQDLVNLYEFTYGALKRNLDGISHADSLVSPPGGCNCINWVLGHMLAARRSVHRLAGAPQDPGGDLLSRYGRGSEPLKPGEAPADLATLRGFLEDSQQALMGTLAALSEEDLNADIPEQMRRPPLVGNVGQGIARLASHESYHTGQIGILRRLIGKEAAIR